MILVIFILLLSEFLFRFFDAEMDTLKFRPAECWFPNWVWYSGNNWKDRNWFIKVPLSMFLDGWHFVKFLAQMVRIIPLCLFACMLLDINFLFTIPGTIVLYGLGGIVWELTYGTNHGT